MGSSIFNRKKIIILKKLRAPTRLPNVARMANPPYPTARRGQDIVQRSAVNDKESAPTSLMAAGNDGTSKRRPRARGRGRRRRKAAAAPPTEPPLQPPPPPLPPAATEKAHRPPFPPPPPPPRQPADLDGTNTRATAIALCIATLQKVLAAVQAQQDPVPVIMRELADLMDD